MVANVEFGYLEESYLEFPYLAGTVHAGLAAELNVFGVGALGAELFAFTEASSGLGVQLIATSTLGYVQCDGQGYLEQPYLQDPYLAAYLCVGLGVELDVITTNGLAVELNVVNYNDVRQRVMCEIESRGDGTNWTASSTLASATDAFNINNVNNDLEESVWRSDSTIVGIQLDNDVGLGNSIFVNTIFIRNHNFTTSASVQLLLSDDPTFTVVGQTLDLTITEAREFYYIAADAPLQGYRYSRWLIDDPTNADGYLQMGVVGYGESEVFEEDCFALPIENEETEYADVIRTEAYTNIMNLRARRKQLRLNFRNINYGSRDWDRFQRIFDCAGIVQKVLWIPTPQEPYRYATWGKLKKLPRYRNNDIGSNSKSYIAFTVELDEVL
jgi:hypothetical protein